MVTIREVQASTNGFDNADKTITLTTCQAGDTIVIVRATNANPFGAAPTSTAGTVTQRAGVTNGFAGRCRLDIYTCPVGSTGSKTVTLPYTDGAGGGAGDIQGHAYVIAGAVSVDGTSTNAGIDAGTASHVINAVSPSGSAALLIGAIAAFVTAAGANYWDPSGSGMTERAESFDSGFLGVWGGSEQLSASGSTGTRTITAVTSDNRYVSAAIAVSPASSEVTGTAVADLGALTATAAGTRTVAGVAVADLSQLVATAAGLRTVTGAALADLGALTATVAGLRTVLGVALADLGALTAHVEGGGGTPPPVFAIGRPRSPWAIAPPRSPWSIGSPR